ncbi:MAG: leucyl aminopeptidase [Acidobacteria bacterium]|nr:leucyl aminopeptidase [Acidobacteriota bacterium]
MNVTVSRELTLSAIDHLYVLVTEEMNLDLPARLRTRIERAIGDSAFEGRSDESITMLAGAPRKITLVGLGKAEALSHRGLRAAIYAVGKTARRQRDKKIGVALCASFPNASLEASTRLAADLVAHSDYKYASYITSAEMKKRGEIACTLVAPASLDRRAVARVAAQSSVLTGAVRTVKDLGNGPGNLVTPTQLAKRAQEVAREAGLKCTVFDKKQIQKLKMGGLLAVNRGSAQEPRFIVMEYVPTGRRPKKTVCLVGKGITFDSGGISLKPGERMEEMKFDMCGAAAVMGTMQAVAKMKLPHRVVGIIPSTENLPSGTAYKPGDIVTTMSGKTIEVVNTDAEGRVILADALTYSTRFKPDHLIDYATLTGACVIALGGAATGLFSTDDELASRLTAAGEEVGERLWRMPVWDDYKDYIKSEWADMKNSGGRAGGAISAAMFLREFVDCPSWAHLDIAGTAWADNETAREAKGATGVGVRATVRFLEELA